MLSEKSLWRHSLRIQDIHQRYCILRQTGSKDDDFKVFANFDQKLLAVRPNKHKNGELATLNLNWQLYVSLISPIEGRMDQSLIHIQ